MGILLYVQDGSLVSAIRVFFYIFVLGSVGGTRYLLDWVYLYILKGL